MYIMSLAFAFISVQLCELHKGKCPNIMAVATYSIVGGGSTDLVVHVGINATHCVLPIPASHQTTQHSGVVVTQTINSMLH